ncbi:MAG: NTP transferase domain-containing protein [Crocinitomicaceae bacterium]|nr:NTP transferase domain-containing protein [Crocinitomicaceae bacterium]
MSEKRAVILAGGKGTRLRPYTVVLPKPLMPVGEYPILEVIIRQLAHFGFNRITITVNHQADLIRSFFGNGEKWNIKIDYSLEDKPLSTMGPLTLIPDLPENFLVMNGDILTDLDFAQFYSEHVKRKSLFSISAARREQVNLYGVLEKNNANHLTGFFEKPKHSFLVSMGIYMVNKETLKSIPENQSFGFDHLMLNFLEEQKDVYVDEFNGYWLDIGRPDDYMQAIEEFESMKNIFMHEK